MTSPVLIFNPEWRIWREWSTPNSPECQILVHHSPLGDIDAAVMQMFLHNHWASLLAWEAA